MKTALYSLLLVSTLVCAEPTYIREGSNPYGKVVGTVK